MEWLWAEWCTQAHANGTMHFEDIQFAGLSTILRLGELTHVPVWEEPAPDNGRSFALAIQPLSPKRLSTPSDLTTDPYIRDGVRLNEFGKPVGYWLAAPRPSTVSTMCHSGPQSLATGDYRYIPARIGHRPGLFHIFRHTEEEQVRGVSCLSPAVKLFRNLTDALDYELLAQVIAASFPVFIGLEEGRPGLPDAVREMYNLDESDERERSLYQEIEPGQVLYGKPGEKLEVVENKRPSPNFNSFVELILRAQGASMGIPYEVIHKDYSRTTYSSARAALNEAWKVFQLYRGWFARLYCQPLWNMVQEEAYLRGRLVLPASAPDFYEARFLWCNAYWYGPSRGYVDPVKEVQANILAIANNLMTRTEHWAQNGGDFWEGMDQIEAESLRMQAMPQQPKAVLNKKTAEKSTADQADAEPGEEESDADD